MVSEMDIRPFDGLGPLTFGMTREEVKLRLGCEPVQFRKGASPRTTLAFDSLGIHAFFDELERLSFVETFLPSQTTYGGLNLLGADLAAIVRTLDARGVASREDGAGGMWFDSEGFVLFARAGTVEGVSAFVKGYPGSEWIGP